MTAMIRQRAVAAPTRQPPPGSVLDCATVIEVDNLWNTFGDGFWAGVSCGSNTIIPKPLCTDTGYTAPSKSFTNPTWTHAHDFGVYRAVSCKAVGFDTQPSDLEAAFDAAEGLSVAKAISDIYQPTAADATAGYSGGAVSGSAVCGFGALLGHALANYGAAATFLLPIGVAVVLQGSQVLRLEPDGSLRSAGGCVAITSVLPSMLALGSIVILRTPRITREVVKPSTNEVFMLTERAYQVGVDCDYAAKAPTAVDCAVLP